MEERNVLDLDFEDISQPAWESIDDELFGIRIGDSFDTCGCSPDCLDCASNRCGPGYCENY